VCFWMWRDRRPIRVCQSKFLFDEFQFQQSEIAMPSP
jgi:hypothetical protein